MRRALLVLCVVLAIVANACYAVAQETDEFDGLEPPVATITLPEKADEPLPDQHNVALEGGSLVIAALYLINYIIGKSQNAAVANKWHEATEPHLIKEFSYTGSSTEPKVGILTESKSLFRYYCTGRRFCSRMIVEIQTISRHDLLARVWNVLVRSPDYLTYNVSLNAVDLDPIVFAICKKLEFNNVTKSFPELITMAKRVEQSDLPDSLCMQSDNVEIPKIALTNALSKQLEILEPFLEFLVLSDVTEQPIVGMPGSERRVLCICFRMQNGSNHLDMVAAASFVTTFIDAVGSTFKLSRELKAAALKKRAKPAQKTVSNDPAESQRIRRLNEQREKKRLEYENLSYEEKQKWDEQQEKKQARKRITRKK